MQSGVTSAWIYTATGQLIKAAKRQEAIDAATRKLVEAAQAIAEYHDSGCSIIGVPGDSIRINALKEALAELKEASK